MEALGFQRRRHLAVKCPPLTFFFFFPNANTVSIGSLFELFWPEEQKDLDLSKLREIVVEINPS